MNANHAFSVAVLAASFAACVPAASAQTYVDSYSRSDQYSQRAPEYVPPAPAYDSTYAYPAGPHQVGTVESVQVIGPARGQSSGAGAVIGGIAGGLVGSELGSGSGNAAATIGGVLGGAYLGNQLERRRASDETYRFNVRMDDGTLQAFTQDTPEIRVGSRVRVTESGQIVLS